jgi:MFS family permease
MSEPLRLFGDLTATVGRMRPKSLVLTFGLLMGMLGAGYGVLFTMLDDYRDEYGISESALGVVIGLGFLSGFASQVLIAPLADRGHARQVVITGMALNVCGLVVMAMATDVVPLMLGRLVMGVGVGMAFPAIRRIVILAEPERLGHNLGRLLAFDVGGFAAGPAVSAALVGPFGIPAPFLVIAAVTVAALPFVARVGVQETADPPTQRFAFDLLRIRPFAGAVALGSAVFLMIGAFDALWAVVLDDLDTNEWIANLGITLFALPLIVLGSAGGRLAQRVGPFRVGTLGLLGGALFMALYGVVPTGGAMFAVAMVHAVNDGFTVSSTGVAVGMVVPAERQAGAQGVLGGFETLTAGITAAATGALYEHFGRATAYGVAAAAMVVLVVVGAMLARQAWSIKGAITSSTATAPAPV